MDEALDESPAGASGRTAGGLRLSGIHEFFGPVAPGPVVSPASGSDGKSMPPQPGRVTSRPATGADRASRPLCLLVHLARQGAIELGGHIVWVGRRCWPNPQFLAHARILDRCLFVDAAAGGDRLWAIELSMRCPAVASVVGDAEAFNISATRRLELVARECNCLTLLARPDSEQAHASAAMTRWAIHPRVCESLHPAWMLELLRCKGRQRAQGSFWPLEWDCAKGAVTISAAVVDRLSMAAPWQDEPRRVAGL